MKLKKLIITAAVLLGSLTMSAQGVDYKPNVSGVVRGRWEMETPDTESRFAIRNARVAISGKIAQPLDYYLRSDFCDLGKMKVLDYWMRMSFGKNLKVKAGQFRVPFGYDSFRGPSNYYFANRSFMGRYIANLRAVGVSVSYSFDKVPFNIEAGVFSPTAISDHSEYTDEKVFAAKGVYQLGDLKLVGGFESYIPEDIRINMYDAAVSYASGRWLVEGEYIYKHYTNSAFDPCHSYNFFANYAMPIKWGVFHELSFQGRWDAAQDHSTGKRGKNGELIVDQPERKRLTLGSQISYKYEKVHCEFRLNFEKFFYNDGQPAPEGRDDKVVAEFVVAF